MSLPEYATRLACVVTDDLNITISLPRDAKTPAKPQSTSADDMSVAVEAIAKAFLWHARRVGDQFEDFGSLFVMELLSEGYAGKQMTDRDIHKILSRIRMRVMRSARREVELTEQTDDYRDGASPEARLMEKEQLQEILNRLDPISVAIAVSLVEGKTKGEIARELGMSRATFHRQCQILREELSQLIDG